MRSASRAVEHELHVAGSFKLFKNHLVHARAGIDQGCCDDGERSAFFDIAGSAEEPFWLMERVGVDTAGQDFP